MRTSKGLQVGESCWGPEVGKAANEAEWRRAAAAGEGRKAAWKGAPLLAEEGHTRQTPTVAAADRQGISQ